MDILSKTRLWLWMAMMAVCTGGRAQEWMDVTDRFITNPSFEFGMGGWNYSSVRAQDGIAYSTTGTVFFMEQYCALPKGMYKLVFNGYEQPGTLSQAVSNYDPDNYHASAGIYINGTFLEHGLKNVASEWMDEPFEGGTKVGDRYYPMNTTGAKACFERGMYQDEIKFEIGDYSGAWIIFETTNPCQLTYWAGVSNFRLYRLSDFVHPESIEIMDGERLELMTTTSHLLTYKVLPEDTSYPAVDWISSNPNVAMVWSSGYIEAGDCGSCIITARSTDPDAPITAQIQVDVVAPKGKATDLMINEICASNGGTYLDRSRNYGSWMELYNPSSEAIMLGGLYVSDDPENLHKFRLPRDYGVIVPGDHQVIGFDHNGIWAYGELLQANFDLSYGGGTIYISDENGIVVQQEYPQAITRTSYARKGDGSGEWGITAHMTPAAENPDAAGLFCTEKAEAPVFSVDGGLHDGDQEVVISVPDGCMGYLTYDGSLPSDSNYYTTWVGDYSINVTGTKYIRAIAYRNGMLPSDVVTRTYIKNEGYTLPIIAITADWEDMHGEDHGILFNGEGYYGRPGNGQQYDRNFNMDWERPVNFEYITDKGEYVLSQEVNMERCGGWSRAYMPYSFKLKANKHLLGKNTLDYKFFDSKPYIKHKTLQIRQGGNDNTGRLKDAALQRIVSTSGLYIDCQESQPVHVFVNGMYIGTENMREPNNKHFGYSNYGIDTDEMDQFEMSPDSGYVQKAGTDEAFMKWYDLSANAADEDAYEEIKKLVDIDEYINYMAVEFFLGNGDWPQNNVKGFRDRNDGRFHFVLFDLDQTFNVADDAIFTKFANKKRYTFDSLLGYNYGTGESLYGKTITAEVKFVTIFLNMLKNATFRKKFIDTFCVVGGSVFNPERSKEIITEMNSRLTKAKNALSYNIRRSSYDNDSWFNPANTANSLLGKLTQSHITSAAAALKNYSTFGLKNIVAKDMKLASNVEGAKMFINDVEIPTGKFNGKIYRPAVLSAKVPAGYRFVGWAKSDDSTLEPDSYSYISNENEFTITAGLSAKALCAIFEPLPEAEIAVSQMRPVMINEVCAKNGIYINDLRKKSDWIELYNTTDADIDIAGLYLTDNAEKMHKYQIPADNPALNTIIPAHGYKVIWTDKQESVSDQLHADFKLDADSAMVMICADPEVADKSLFNEHFSETWTDSLGYYSMGDNETVGRYPDGGSSTYLMTTPTLGASNRLSIYSLPVWLDPVEVGIHAITLNDDALPGSATGVYTLDGVRTDRIQPGINIVKYSDGSIRKVLRR